MSEELPPMEPRLRALFKAEADAPFLSPEMAARIRAGVLDQIGGTGGGGSAAAPPSPATPAPTAPVPGAISAASTPLASFVGALVLVATFSLGVVVGRTTTPPAEPPQARQTEAPVQAPIATPMQAATPAPEAVPSSTAATPTRPAVDAPRAKRPAFGAKPKAPRGNLFAEQALLDRARVALTRGLPEDALAAVRQHARDFPDGRLAAERDGLLVLALAKSGAQEDAERAARAYLERYPEGVLVDAVRAVLER